MRLFGFEIARRKDVNAVPVSGGAGVWGYLGDRVFNGWQKGLRPESERNLLAFSAVYACVSMIAGDISKLRIKLVEDAEGISREVKSGSPLGPVLVKPNAYQTRMQFLSQWITSKLLHGNAYILKERDNRNVVTALYPLHPRAVIPKVADDGSVWYDVRRDYLSNVDSDETFPSSEIIHDRGVCLFHPLVGISPIYACGLSATQGLRIQQNSQEFFENMSRPSGQLTAPGTIDDVTALRLKETFEQKFGAGGGLGRLFVGGDGLAYQPITMPASDAQLIEQLKWTVEDVARCFRVPMYKLGVDAHTTRNNVEQLNQDYYSQTLQELIECAELLLDEGLGLENAGYGVELDLDGLLRMDPLARAQQHAALVGAAIEAPNDARFFHNLPPVPGGESPLIQQQYYSLAALAKRDANDPFAKPTNPPPAPPAPDANGAKVIEPDFARWKYARALRKKKAA